MTLGVAEVWDECTLEEEEEEEEEEQTSVNAEAENTDSNGPTNEGNITIDKEEGGCSLIFWGFPFLLFRRNLDDDARKQRTKK